MGVQLLETDADELSAIVLDAYRTVAPQKLLARLDVNPSVTAPATDS